MKTNVWDQEQLLPDNHRAVKHYNLQLSCELHRLGWGIVLVFAILLIDFILLMSLHNRHPILVKNLIGLVNTTFTAHEGSLYLFQIFISVFLNSIF